MIAFEGLCFSPFTKEDVPVLTPVMKRAFDDDARRFFPNPTGGPDGYDDGSFLQKWAVDAQSDAYRVDLDGKPVGAVILFFSPSKTEGFLGCLFVDADLIATGVGTRIWHFVEHQYPKVRVWNTETPAVSYRNHCFYVNRCGFHVIGVERKDDRFDAQFRLRKEMP